MIEACVSTVQNSVKPTQRCQRVSRSMPRRRSRNGSRAMRISCSIISDAACSAKNFATVSVAFLPAPSVKKATSTTARCTSSTAAQHELGRRGGRQPRAGLRRARRRHRNLLVGPGRDHHRGDSGRICRFRRIGTGISTQSCGPTPRWVDDAVDAASLFPISVAASVWSVIGCSVRPCRLRWIGSAGDERRGGAGWQRRMVAVTAACPGSTRRVRLALLTSRWSQRSGRGLNPTPQSR